MPPVRPRVECAARSVKPDIAGTTEPANRLNIDAGLMPERAPLFRLSLALSLAAAGLAPGCAETAVRSADRAGAEIRLEKEAEMEAMRRRAAAGADRVSTTTGVTATSAVAGDESAVPIPGVLGLADAIRIATAHNRDY